MVSPVILRPAAWKTVLLRVKNQYWLTNLFSLLLPGSRSCFTRDKLAQPQAKCQAQKLTSVWESLVLIFHSFLPLYVAFVVSWCAQILQYHWQHQDWEGEEGARTTARDDQDGNQWGGNRRGDGEGEEVLPAPDVRGQSDVVICIAWFDFD